MADIVEEPKHTFLKNIRNRLKIMLNVVSDLIDLKDIRNNQFVSMEESFSPLDSLLNIMSIFEE